MKIYLAIPLIAAAVLTCRADIVLPITSGEVDVFAGGFGTGNTSVTSEFALFGHGFEFQGSGASSIYSCAEQAPCAPLSTIPAALIGPTSVGEQIVLNLFYQGGYLTPLSGNLRQNAFADIEFQFDYVAPPIGPPSAFQQSSAIIGPFTEVAHFRDPSVAGGQQFDFVGQGTGSVALLALPFQTDWELRSARFVFTAVPEPGFGLLVALGLLAATIGGRSPGQKDRPEEAAHQPRGREAHLGGHEKALAAYRAAKAKSK